jgi:gas vesicle protein
MLNFLTGFGCGIAMGILFAPKSGEHTREYLASMASGGVGYIKRQAGEIRETALDAVERGRDVVNRQMERLAAAGQNSAAEVYQR